MNSPQQVRAALLREAVPLRGPERAGDLVCFPRREGWNGPRSVIERKELRIT